MKTMPIDLRSLSPEYKGGGSMRILVLSHMYPNPINPVYGIFVHDQVLALEKLGHDLRVISPVAVAPFPLPVLSAKWRNYAGIPKAANIDGIQVRHPRVLNLPGGAMLDRVGTAWYRSLRKPVQELYSQFPFDIIHCHVALPDGHAGMLLAKEYNKPVIAFVHGADFHATLHRGKRYRDALRQVLKTCNRVVTVSTKLEKIGVDLTGDSSLFETIPNGINLDKVYTGPSPLAEIYRNKTVLLAVGNLKETKGFDLAIQALARLNQNHPQLCLLIAGSGPEAENLRALAAQLGVEEKVEFLGRLEHAKVMEYMSLADVFVLPSWQEGFGVVYVEAMAHGLPIIGCQGQGIADIIESGKNGILVPPRDIDALVAALEDLVTNPGRAREIGAEGRNLVFSHLTWEHNAQKVIALSRGLMQ